MPWLKAMALRVCQYNEPEAEDLSQEVCVQALKDMNRFGCDRDFKAWAAVALNHTRIDHQRKRNRARQIREDLAKVDPEPCTSREIYANATPLQFAAAFEKLSAGQREVLRLHLKGWDYETIAWKLGLNENAVRKRLHDARSALRKHLLN